MTDTPSTPRLPAGDVIDLERVGVRFGTLAAPIVALPRPR